MRWAGQHLVFSPAGLGAVPERATASFHGQHGAAMCCCCRPAVPLVLTCCSACIWQRLNAATGELCMGWRTVEMGDCDQDHLEMDAWLPARQLAT